ncbi:hypothetical protein FF36_05684 [Frankia torreyi]|uniref:Uncharacterized protein n=1 Tax=Frankia torreyi TaxID=1856 RepID=A0A0D8B760_9ACTN|nr:MULTISPECIES: hypothetical protein [Frankia]KJE20021.1 hypothetical protein FF36_05684 [Frankia torreyi]KQM02010.1 hypothetical protein FF86_10864 [Frankia sp. CpI1-P]
MLSIEGVRRPGSQTGAGGLNRRYRDPVRPVFRAAADCARGAKPVFADRLAGLRAAADCTRAEAFAVVGVDRDALLPPLLLAIVITLLPVSSMSVP